MASFSLKLTGHARKDDYRENGVRPGSVLVQDHSGGNTSHGWTESSAREHDSQHAHSNSQMVSQIKEGGSKHKYTGTLQLATM